MSSARASSTLNFPRLSFEEGTFTGIAIVNLSSQEATVTLTAYGENGEVLAGIENPVDLIVPANQQTARLVTDLFGGSLDPSTVGWFQHRTEHH